MFTLIITCVSFVGGLLEVRGWVYNTPMGLLCQKIHYSFYSDLYKGV